MAANWIAGLPLYLQGATHDALQLWYEYRSAALMAVFFLLLMVRIYLHTPDERGTNVMLTNIYKEDSRPTGGEAEGSRREGGGEGGREGRGPGSDEGATTRRNIGLAGSMGEEARPASA